MSSFGQNAGRVLEIRLAPQNDVCLAQYVLRTGRRSYFYRQLQIENIILFSFGKVLFFIQPYDLEVDRAVLKNER